MNTPIYDYVTSYVEQNPHRMHMPGHKGAPYLGCEYRDITEITGADALYEADGIIMESEGYAAELFGSGRTLYSTEGSTQCIKGMLYLAMQLAAPCEKPVILAGRNAHKAFLYGCALLDLTVNWLYPEDGAHSICSCPITAKDVETALKNADTKPVAVYLTTPDYLGGMVDVAAVAKVCRRYAVPLLVDNAHGAYLKFLQPSLHPMDLGADLCCDSAHKTLPVLTGGAYLHLSHDAASKVGHIAKTAMGIFGSTSPSYLTLQSLDLCNRYLSDGYQNKLKQTICSIDDAKAKLSAMGYTILPSDPLK
ncbi:MAG: amino acid decarboxylase, partial [Clostridiales bacterium]|nr:amino acid decarboxylase [Clostridiales bacterium]